MIFFIVRPMRLNYNTQAVCEKIGKKMRACKREYKLEVSQYPGHAALLARQAIAQGASCVVACGGDGTLHEISGALMDTGVPMGIIPIGTGNDFVRSLDIPKKLDAALDVVLAGSSRRIDMGSASGRPFINVAGIGYDAEVVATTAILKKLHFRGFFTYGFATILTLFKMRYNDVTITIDGKQKRMRALFIAAANGRMIGGGMQVAPHAVLDDGLFDVCIVRAIPPLRILTLMPSFIKGKHIELDICEYMRASRVEVCCDRTINVQLDGELEEASSIVFEIKPASLLIITP